MGQLHTELILGEVIGEGGMGVVYRASLKSENGFARDVAAKKLKKPGADQLGVFLQEAKLAAQLHHPNISSVLDIRESDGDLYLISDLIEGNSMREIVRAKKALGENLSEDAVLFIIRGIANALSYAHNRGILHLDISPSNIMIDRFGIPKLIDFGISESKNASSATTGRVVMGQASYVAPERLAPTPLNLAQSDVFSLGVVAVELLGGHLSVRSTSDLYTALKEVSITETMDSLRVKKRKAKEIIGQMIRPNVEDRIPTNELVDALDRLDVDAQKATSEIQGLFASLNSGVRAISETRTVALSHSLLPLEKNTRKKSILGIAVAVVIAVIGSAVLIGHRPNDESESLFKLRLIVEGKPSTLSDAGLKSENLVTDQLPIFTCDSLFRNLVSFPMMLFSPYGRKSLLEGTIKRSFKDAALEIFREENLRLKRANFIFEKCKHMSNLEKVKLIYFGPIQLLEKAVEEKINRVEDLYAKSKTNESVLATLESEAFPEYFAGYNDEVQRLQLDKFAKISLESNDSDINQIKLAPQDYPKNAKECLYKMDSIWGHKYVYWNYPSMAPTDSVKFIVTPFDQGLKIKITNSKELLLDADSSSSILNIGLCEYTRIGNLAKVKFWIPIKK